MKAKKQTKPEAKKRNPQDATMRNINALKKRVARLEQWLEALTLDIAGDKKNAQR